jgi:hypothetical protein
MQSISDICAIKICLWVITNVLSKRVVRCRATLGDLVN